MDEYLGPVVHNILSSLIQYKLSKCTESAASEYKERSDGCYHSSLMSVVHSSPRPSVVDALPPCGMSANTVLTDLSLPACHSEYIVI